MDHFWALVCYSGAFVTDDGDWVTAYDAAEVLAAWPSRPTKAEVATIFDNPDDRDRFDADVIAKIVSGGRFCYSTDESEYTVFITEYPIGRAL